MQSKKILIIENSWLDAILIEEALYQKGDEFTIDHLMEEREIKDYLKSFPFLLFQDIPDLIIVNEELIFLDRMNLIKKINSFGYDIPVIVLTSAKGAKNSYDLTNSNCYFAKPLEINQFVNVIQEIKDFWLPKS
jgi:chemotaxis family two-component system response regulator Rcp1